MSGHLESWNYQQNSEQIAFQFVKPNVKKVIYSDSRIEDKENAARIIEDTIENRQVLLERIRVPEMLDDINMRRFEGKGTLLGQAGLEFITHQRSGVQRVTQLAVVSTFSLMYERGSNGTQKLYGSITFGVLNNGLYGRADNLHRRLDLTNPTDVLSVSTQIKEKPIARLSNRHAGEAGLFHALLVDGRYASGQDAIDALTVSSLIGLRETLRPTFSPEVPVV